MTEISNNKYKGGRRIPDVVFRTLAHNCKGYNVYLAGKQLEKGYKPDFVLKKANEYLILECETKTDRKCYVGAMIKAAHFLTGNRKGKLVFVVVEFDNTRPSSIARHLNKYFKWIKHQTNLSEVFVIATDHYYQNEELLALLDKKFLSLAIKVLND